MHLSAALCYSDSTHFHISTEATLLRCFLFELCHRFAILLEFLHTGVTCVQPLLVEHQMLSRVLTRNLVEVAPCWRPAACGRQCGRSPGPCCYLAALDVRTWLFEVTSSGLHMCKVRRTVLDEARRLTRGRGAQGSRGWVPRPGCAVDVVKRRRVPVAEDIPVILRTLGGTIAVTCGETFLVRSNGPVHSASGLGCSLRRSWARQRSL